MQRDKEVRNQASNWSGEEAESSFTNIYSWAYSLSQVWLSHGITQRTIWYVLGLLPISLLQRHKKVLILYFFVDLKILLCALKVSQTEQIVKMYSS